MWYECKKAILIYLHTILLQLMLLNITISEAEAKIQAI